MLLGRMKLKGNDEIEMILFDPVGAECFGVICFDFMALIYNII